VYEAAVKDALYTLINANKAALVSGITEQGSARAVQLVKETVAPLQSPYYVSLAVGAMRTWEDAGDQTVSYRSNMISGEYEVEVEVFDYARDLQGGLHAFELSGKNFDLLVARLAKLVREQSTFTSSVHGTHTFRLKQSSDPQANRRIDVEVTDYPAGMIGASAAFYAKLRFTLSEECVSLAGAG
jgi:hypothetical protein